MIWKILTLSFAATSVLLLLLHFKQLQEHKPLDEPRLIGNWISDKERTQEYLPAWMSEPDKKMLLSVLRSLKVTYTPTEYTTELDGETETFPYTVLGRDEHSVVIRGESAPRNDLAPFNMKESTFSIIHFDSPDSYWVMTDELREFFRRESAAPKQNTITTEPLKE
jgi:hypothetical protein